MTSDYQITLYKGYDSNLEGVPAYEKIDIVGDDGLYYSGFFDMVDLTSGLYTAVSESKGYLTNFVKFAVTSSLIQGIKPFPIIFKVEEG
jgi:hypothetical protein